MWIIIGVFFYYNLVREKGLEYRYKFVYRFGGGDMRYNRFIYFRNFIIVMWGKVISWDLGLRGYGGWVVERYDRRKRIGFYFDLVIMKCVLLGKFVNLYDFSLFLYKMKLIIFV